MCLGIPGEIVAIEQSAEQGALLQGIVAFGGVRKRVCLAFVPQAKVGDHAIVHAGFALDLIDEERAREIFTTLADLDPSLVAEEPRPAAVPAVGRGGPLGEIPG